MCIGVGTLSTLFSFSLSFTTVRYRPFSLCLHGLGVVSLWLAPPVYFALTSAQVTRTAYSGHYSFGFLAALGAALTATVALWVTVLIDMVLLLSMPPRPRRQRPSRRQWQTAQQQARQISWESLSS